MPNGDSDIELLLRNLGAADPRVREQATAALIGMGLSVITKLGPAISSTDPEVRERVRLIIASLRASESSRATVRMAAGNEMLSRRVTQWRERDLRDLQVLTVESGELVVSLQINDPQGSLRGNTDLIAENLPSFVTDPERVDEEDKQRLSQQLFEAVAPAISASTLVQVQDFNKQLSDAQDVLNRMIIEINSRGLVTVASEFVPESEIATPPDALKKALDARRRLAQPKPKR